MKKYTGKNRTARYLIALAVAFSAIATTPAQATGNNIYVAPTGSVGTGASCASPAFVGGSSIASAVAAAVDGDTVILCNGTFSVSSQIFIDEKEITVSGESSAQNTIIDGAGSTTGIFKIISTKNVTIQNLTFFRGNNTQSGGAIYSSMTSSQSLSTTRHLITNNIFAQNQASSQGGAISGVGDDMGSGNFQGILTISNNTFVENKAGMDGGAIDMGAVTFDPTRVVVQSNKFLYNRAIGRAGGAVVSNFSYLTSVSNIFYLNTTGDGGNAQTLYGGMTLSGDILMNDLSSGRKDCLLSNLNPTVVSESFTDNPYCHDFDNNQSTGDLKTITRAEGLALAGNLIPQSPLVSSHSASLNSVTLTLATRGTGSSAITQYSYSLDGGAFVNFPAGGSSSQSITGLASANTYQVRLKATSAAGTSYESAPYAVSTLIPFNSSSGSGNIPCSVTGYFTMANFEVTSSSNCVGAVTTPSGTTAIGYLAFEDSGVTSINIPNTVTTIGGGAFRRATNLTTVTFENGSRLTSIESAAFERTAIASITLPDTLTSLGNYAFWRNSALTSITIPDGVTALYQNSFAYITTLRSVTLPGTLTMIDWETFKGATALETLAIPNRVSSIGANAFTDTTGLTMYSYCGTVSDEELTAAGLGGKTKTCVPPISFNCPIGGGTYQVDSGILIGTTGVCGGALTLDSSVRAIDSQALRNNQLTSLTIPESVTSIIGSPFGQNGSRSLVSINVAETNPNYSSTDGVLFNKLKTQLITYPGKKPGTSYTIPSSVTSIRSLGFANSNYLTSVSIPNSVTTLDGATFLNSQVLSTINIGSGLTNWNYDDFTMVPTLASINVDAANPALASIDGVLYDKDIQTLYLYPAAKVGRSYVAPNTLLFVANAALSGTKNLATADLSSVIYIGDSVFMGATSIQEVTFGDPLEYLSSQLFQSALNLKKITLGTGLFWIADDAFLGNDNFYCVVYTGSDSYIQNFPYPNGVIPVRNSSGCQTPFLKSLTKPKINLKDGKYVCSVGTYVFGYAHDGVIDASTSGLVTPSKYIYNLLFSGVAQPALAATTANLTNSWSITKLSSGTLISCSVTVTVNSLSTSDLSTENSDGLAAAQSARSKVVKAAEATYKTAAKSIPLIYQKTLVDARAIWRKQTDAIRTNYFIVLDRIAANRGSKMISDVATATEVTNAAKAKATADYAANKLAAFLTADKASKAAIDAKTAAIAQANAAYGTHIESIGHGVLIP
jgi:predicted outer membrane repeat protein